MHSTSEKILTRPQLITEIMRWRLKNNVVVFTNGCFDLLHRGHAEYLEKAKALGNRLIVGLNGDRSPWFVKKGRGRPYVDEQSRARLLAAFQAVDAVVIFEEETPEALIGEVKPDVLVKGGDYKPEQVVGSDFVFARGGRVEIIPFVDGFSSTALIEIIKNT